MSGWRRIAAVAVIVVTAIALYAACVRPLHCHLREEPLELATMSVLARPDRALARATIAEALACARVRPNHVNFYLIAAAAAGTLGQNERAITLYREALRHDRRPEIYAALGNVLARIGEHDEAVEMLFLANQFFPGRINDIEDPFVHDEVERRFREYRATIEKGK